MELSIANVYPSPGAGTGGISGVGGVDEDVKPYRIHVSSKYLDLTKKKLELTRLPHELLLPKEREWELGTPKSEVEPLIDYWLEHYNWRTRETHLNNTLPQFRTAISIPDSPNALRIHFIHIRSAKPNAIPLLLLPSFPFTNLSLAPLFPSLTSPPLTSSTQAFHLVIPSLPGLGFSDAFQKDAKLLEKTAGAVDILMRRLGYEFYLASGTGSGRESPAGMDYHLLRLLAENHQDSCLGVHLIDPYIARLTPRTQPLHWLKFNVARFFHAEIFGYEKRDFLSLRRDARSKTHSGLFSRGVGTSGLGLALSQPSTLSYALCDSPVGLLSFVCAGLRRASPKHKLSSAEVVDLAQLAWLPGPEASMRFVHAAAREVAEFENLKSASTRKQKRKSRVAVTVFGAGEEVKDEGEGYTCPAWAAQRHEVLCSQRVEGRAGLVAFERPEVVYMGCRALARRVMEVDGRLGVVGLEGVVVDPADGFGEGGGVGVGERVGSGGAGVEEEYDDGAVVEVRELGSASEDGEWDDSIDEEENETGEEEEDGESASMLQLDVESPDTVVGVDVGRRGELR